MARTNNNNISSLTTNSIPYVSSLGLSDDNTYLRYDPINRTLISGITSGYSFAGNPSGIFLRTLSNTSNSFILGNNSSTGNASVDLVFINDATDSFGAAPIFDIGFNSSVGDTTKETFAAAFPAPSTVTFSNGSSTLTKVAHGLSVNQVVQFTTSGALPTNFALATNYYIVSVPTADTFTVSATYGGIAILAGSAGSGTHNWKIFGADLAGEYDLGVTTPQVVSITTSGGDIVSATFTLSSIQVLWTVGLTAAATAIVTGAFPFSGLTGGSTSYQYNTTGKHVFINATSGKSFDWLLGGFASTNLGMTLNATGLGIGNQNSAPTYLLDVLGGDMGIATVGKTLRIKTGANSMMGTAVLVAGTVAITITGLTIADEAFLQLTIPGGTTGTQYKAVCTANTLTITSVAVATGVIVNTDTSTLNYLIIRPY